MLYGSECTHTVIPVTHLLCDPGKVTKSLWALVSLSVK